MQLQVECNEVVQSTRSCWTCDRSFEMPEARVMVCSDQGVCYGEACPDCIGKGFNWMSQRFEQLVQPLSQSVAKTKKRVHGSLSHLETRIGA